MTHPYVGALALGYILKERPVNLQSLFDEMFGLEPKKFDQPVGTDIPPIDEDFPGEFDLPGPEDIAEQEAAKMEEMPAQEMVVEEEGTMEEILEVQETQILPTVGAIQEEIISSEPTIAGLAGQLTTAFPSGTEEAVEEAVRSLTAADLRRRRRVRVDPGIILDPVEPVFPTVGSSAQEAGLEVQRGFIDGVEI